MRIGERLRYARERAGLTLAQAKSKSGLGESSISEFENGKRQPSLAQLQSLAAAYSRSIAFFFEEGPVRQDLVLWRERPLQGEPDVEARFLRLCEQYHNLEVWTNDKPVSPLVRVSAREFPKFGYAEAEELAKRLRRELQLGARPGPVLARVLAEVCGVKVFHLDFEPTGTAASTFSDSFGPAVLLNAQNARWRRNFDLAHELFHLVTWELFVTERKTASLSEPKEEDLATCFARNLLMPVDVVRSAVNNRRKDDKIDDEAIYSIAREFDVSVEALMWHIHMIYRRPKDKHRTQHDINRLKSLAPVFEDRQSESPPAYPERYEALAVRALRNGHMSIGRFAEYMGISRSEALRRITQEELPGDGKAEVTLA